MLVDAGLEVDNKAPASLLIDEEGLMDVRHIAGAQLNDLLPDQLCHGLTPARVHVRSFTHRRRRLQLGGCTGLDLDLHVVLLGQHSRATYVQVVDEDLAVLLQQP